MRQEITAANAALIVTGAAASTGGPDASGTLLVKGFRDKTVQIAGTFVGSVSIQATLDEARRVQVSAS